MSSIFGGPRAAEMLQRGQQRLDTEIYRLTRGRHTIASIGAGFNVVLLTTIGAKSKQPRQVVLAALRYDGGYLVIGSNFGRQHHPAWVHNLRANPDVLAEMGGFAAQARHRIKGGRAGASVGVRDRHLPGFRELQTQGCAPGDPAVRAPPDHPARSARTLVIADETAICSVMCRLRAYFPLDQRSSPSTRQDGQLEYFGRGAE